MQFAHNQTRTLLTALSGDVIVGYVERCGVDRWLWSLKDQQRRGVVPSERQAKLELIVAFTMLERTRRSCFRLRVRLFL